MLAGSLKATYDLGILAVFAGHVSHEDKAKAAAEAQAAANNGPVIENGVGEDNPVS